MAPPPSSPNSSHHISKQGTMSEGGFAPEVRQLVGQLKPVDLRSIDAEPDCFIAEGVSLRPVACSLASAGRQARVGAAASGAWRGSLAGTADSLVEGGDAIAAACSLAPLLAGTVLLDGCGILAEADLSASASSLRFRRAAQWEDEEASEKAKEALGGAVTMLKLTGRLGQILTHNANLWLRPNGSDFEVLLVLQPRKRHATAANTFEIAKNGPMGPVAQRWNEVALVELPKLLRLTMDASLDRRAAALAPLDPSKFLVDEEEEIVKINCWHRVAGDGGPTLASGDAISIEQLTWYTTVAALSETPPCAEAAVPMQRLELSDEGAATRQELLGEVAEHDVPKEDAPRLASLVFLRQFVSREVIEEEVLPRLLPSDSGIVRVLSAQLNSRPNATQPGLVTGKQNKPKSLDDLFGAELDFRAPLPWGAKSKEEDPLAQHDLTSVLLLNESSGFMMSFHCLQGVDPLAS